MNLKNLSAQNKKHKKILSRLNQKKISKIYNEFSSSLKVKEDLAVAVSGGPDSLALAYLAKCYSLKNNIKVKYKHINIEDFYKSTDEKFDVITCLEMLEHVPDPNSIIYTCSRLLKPGGKIFFSTINKNLKSFLFAIIGAEYILNLLPRGTHEYKKFIKPSQLQSWARNNSLSFDSIVGVSYNPVTQKYKLSQDTSVNYIVEASLIDD